MENWFPDQLIDPLEACKPAIALGQALWKANETHHNDLKWMQGIQDIQWINTVFELDPTYRDDHLNYSQRAVLWTSQILE